MQARVTAIQLNSKGTLWSRKKAVGITSLAACLDKRVMYYFIFAQRYKWDKE